MLPLGSVIRGRSGDRYIIEGLLGRGGFSAIYLARDRYNGKLYALKELAGTDKREKGQLFSEADILKRLNHPVLPRVYHVFEDVKLKRIYLLMDYIEGKDLEALRRNQPDKRFSLALTIKMLSSVAEALSYLHNQERPVIHRDIKPSNIIVSVPGENTFLVDFGLAKEYIEDQTTSIFRYGTPGYAAPEQYNQGTSIQTDVYGLSATIYTLLTGAIPADALSRCVGGDRDPLIPVDQACAEIPAPVARVIERAMNLSRTDRFLTVAQFWRELDEAVLASVDTACLVDTPLPFTPHDFAAIPTRNLHKKPLMLHLGWRMGVPLALIALGLLAFIVNIILFGAVWARHAPVVQSSLHPTSTSDQRVSPTVVAGGSLYPQLGACYAGMADVNGVTKGKSDIHLSNVQQQDNKIAGNFSGLSQVGNFTGTVDAVSTSSDPQKPAIHFNVQLPSLGDTLFFTGTPKIGGEIAGEYSSANVQGEKTGYYGSWDVLPCGTTIQ